MKKIIISCIILFYGSCFASDVAYFRVKPSQIVSKFRCSIMTTKKDPSELDIVPNAKGCYTFPNGDKIVSVLINEHGVKRLHKRFYEFESVEDPTDEELAKMQKFAEVKAKHPSKFKFDSESMDEIGIKGDFIGYTEQSVYDLYPDLDGWIQSGVYEETGNPVWRRIFNPANWAR